jgi:putative peptidoglycan lipid II flippase
MKLIKAMATVAGFTFLSRILGFIRDILTATVMGAGPLADAFFVALKLPNLFRRISAEGAFSVAFIPLFSESIEKDGDEESLRMARNMMGYMFAFITIFSVVAIIGMPYIIMAIAPGFEYGGARYETAVELSRITFPYLLFISLSALLGGVMNSVGRFGVYAFIPVLFNLCLIGVLLTHDMIWDTPAKSLAYGVAIAGVIQFAWIFIYAARHGWLVYPTFPKLTPKVKKLFVLMLPGILGAGVYHLNIFADMVIASFLDSGSISYLYYADRLQQLPLGVVGIAVGTALLPLLSRSLVAKRYEEANNSFNRALEACLLLAMPAATALIIAAKPIIMGLFNYGAFTVADTSVTSLVLTCYALGLPAYIVAKVFQSACFARQDTKTPVKISMICALTNIALGLTFSQYIGVAGIALATAFSGFIQVVLLYRITRTIDHLGFDDQLKRNAFKIMLSCIIMACAIWGYTQILGANFEQANTGRVLTLIGLVASGGLAYLLSITFMRVINIRDIRNMMKKKA